MLLQVSDYFEISSTISDGIYESTLFRATGFHRWQIIIASHFLVISL
jgi:heme/copper-type cytochrome/quinol oxidase subunit 3